MLSVVSYRVAASLLSALFSCQALLLSVIALVSVPFFFSALARLVIMRVVRSSVIPSVLSVSSMLCSVSPMPRINARSASVASTPQSALNSVAVIPAAAAHSSRSLPVSTAVCISPIRLLILVPPVVASMPRLVTAAERASISVSLMPAFVPAPAVAWAISVIFFSVVLKLLPSATMLLPRLA